MQQLGGVTPYWGYSESPLIVGDRIVLDAGGRRASIVAVNKADGKVLWQQPGDEAGYSSPVLLRTGSLQQVVFFMASRGWPWTRGTAGCCGRTKARGKQHRQCRHARW